LLSRADLSPRGICRVPHPSRFCLCGTLRPAVTIRSTIAIRIRACHGLELTTGNCQPINCSLFSTLPCSAQFCFNCFGRAHCSPLKSGRHTAGTGRPYELARCPRFAPCFWAITWAKPEVGAAPALGAPQIQQNRRTLHGWPPYPRFWDMWGFRTLGSHSYRPPQAGDRMGLGVSVG